MKVKPLKHNDIVKLAAHELNQGSKLNKVEKDLHKLGIGRAEALKAIEEADYYKKREEEIKAKKEAAKQQQTAQAEAKETAPQSKEKSTFWFWIIIIFVAGVALYLFFSGIISPMELIKNFK